MSNRFLDPAFTVCLIAIAVQPCFAGTVVHSNSHSKPQSDSVCNAHSGLHPDAHSKSATTSRPQLVYPAPTKVHGPIPGLTYTTGWRPISGWEQSVTRRDKNLSHWAWEPMQEMNKAVMRPSHGSAGRSPHAVSEAAASSSVFHYIKPIHVSTAVPQRPGAPQRPASQTPVAQNPSVPQSPAGPHGQPVAPGPQGPPGTQGPSRQFPSHHLLPPSTVAHSPTSVAQPPSSHYSRPTHLPFPPTANNRADSAVAGRMVQTDTNLRYSAKQLTPRTAEALAVAARRLPAQKPPTPAMADAMSAAANKPEQSDSFQDPDMERSNAYGAPNRSVFHYGGKSAAASVHGKILRKYK